MHEHLGNAPIVEALVDFQVEPIVERPELLDEVHAALKDQYPERRSLMNLHIALDAPADGPASQRR